MEAKMPSPLRSVARQSRSTPLGSINNPNSNAYQALVGMADDLAVGNGGVEGLSPISYETSVGITAVWRAANLIAGSIAALPFHVYEKGPDGSRRMVGPGEPGYWIDDDPNPEWLPNILWETSILDCLLAGNCYWGVEVDGLGRPARITPIEPKRVRVGRSREDGLKYFQIDSAEVFREYRDGAGEIVHIPGMTFDNVKGVSVISACRMALQVTRAAEESGARAFANDSTPGGILETDADLEVDEVNKLKAAWERHHRGGANRNRIAVVTNGAKYRQTQLNLADMQFLESRKFQVSEVARMFGVPNYLLFDQEKTSSWGSGIEEQGRNMLTFTFSQWITRFENAVTKRILAGLPNTYGKFELKGLLRADIDRRGRFYALGRQWGWYSINDIRRLEEMDGIGPEGDDYLQPMNMTPVAPNGENDPLMMKSLPLNDA